MKKKDIKRAFISVILFVLVVAAFLIINEEINNRKRFTVKWIKDSQDYCYSVEEVSMDDKKLEIKGFFFELEKVRNIEKNNVFKGDDIELVLININDALKYDDINAPFLYGEAMTTRKVQRPDVNKVYECEYDYTESGFESSIELDKIDLENNTYQVFYKKNGDQPEGIGLQVFVNKEGVFFTEKNQTYEDYDRFGSYADFFKECICLVADIDFHIFVFQKDDLLYWVAENGFEFDSNGKTSIQFQGDTTQFSKIMKKEDDPAWIYNSFYFEDKEDVTLSNEYVRIAKVELPKDYSITRAWTGRNELGKWIWLDYFRPLYTK